MNILIFSWRGPGHPLAGGAEVATYEHAKGWVDAGHDVTLFTSAFKSCKKQETVGGIKIIRRGFDVFGVHILAFFWYLFGNHIKFDLIIDEFHGIPFFTPLYVRTKKIGWIHEVAKEVWWLNPWPKPFNYVPGFIGYVFEPLIFKFIYHEVPFMTVSDSTKNDLVKWNIPRNHIRVIHNGVNIISVKVKKENKKTIIFLGAIAKDKGIEDALKVFGFINKKETNWQFWVVGQGTKEYLDKLKVLAKILKIKNNLKLFGFVDNKKKFELLSRAHMLVNPSVREGWGLVNIEANAVGTPVAAYNVPGSRDSVLDGKTGKLVKFGDIQGLSASIVEIVNSRKVYNLMQEKCLVWSKKFSWEKATRESLKFVENLS